MISNAESPKNCQGDSSVGSETLQAKNYREFLPGNLSTPSVTHPFPHISFIPNKEKSEPKDLTIFSWYQASQGHYKERKLKVNNSNEWKCEHSQRYTS